MSAKKKSETPSGLSHVGEDGQPRMVDVSAKQVALREAHAQCNVVFPPAVARALKKQDFHTPKGPVFQTAIIAGVTGAKQTSSLIPFCHPLPLEHCRVDIKMKGSKAVIDCCVRVTHKTGVEMEALTGASMAALTVYDMCKALSHEMTIENLHLVSKRGGRRDVGSKRN